MTAPTIKIRTLRAEALNLRIDAAELTFLRARAGHRLRAETAVACRNCRRGRLHRRKRAC